MVTDKQSQKTFITVNVFLALICISLCGIMNSIASSIISDHQQLTLFRQQLFFSGISVYLLFASGYFLYQRRTTQQQTHATQKTHTKDTNTQKITPVQTPNKKQHRTTTNPPIKDRPHISAETLRILAVDDNTANLLVIQNYLAMQNIPVILASSGIEALTIVETQGVDIIFMDIEMSGMDGIQTTHSIRAQEQSRTPIVAISAHNENDKRLEILAHGFDDFLAKPISADTLSATLQRWCPTEKSHSHRVTTTTTAVEKTHSTPSSSSSKATHRQQVVDIQTPSTTQVIKKVVDINTSLVHSNHNNALAKDMLDLLIQMIKEEKEHINLHHSNQEWDSLYKLNHKIYGGSSYCGVPALQSANQQLEKLLQATLRFGEADSNDLSLENDLLDTENNGMHTEKIDHAVTQLLSAINDLILWDDEYDTSIVFDVEEH